MTLVNWHTGDLAPPLAGTCLDGGDPVDLSEADSLTVNILRPDESVISRSATAEDQKVKLGSWFFAWHEGDLSLPGSYKAELKVSAGGRVQTFGPAEFYVRESIS